MSTDGGRPAVRLEPGRPRAARRAGARAAARRVRARPRRPRARQRRDDRLRRARAPVRRQRQRRRGRDVRLAACAATCGRTRAGSCARRRPRRGSIHEAADAWAPAAQRPVRRAELLPRLVPVARAAQARLAGRRAQLGRRARTRRASTTARTSRSRGTRRGAARHRCATSRSTCARSRATTSSTSPTPTACASATRCTSGSRDRFHPYAEIELLRRLGKKIVYSNNGCLDGVSQTLVRVVGRHAGVPRLPVARAAGRLQRRAQPRAGATTATGWPTSSATSATTARTTTTTRRVHEVPEFFCLDPELLAPRPRGPGALEARPAGEHRADLPRGRQLPAAHRRRAATSSPATSTCR